MSICWVVHGISWGRGVSEPEYKFLCKKKTYYLVDMPEYPTPPSRSASVQARELAHTALGAVTPLHLARNPTGPTH